MNSAITKRAFVKFASGIQVSLNHQRLKDLGGSLFEGSFGEGCNRMRKVNFFTKCPLHSLLNGLMAQTRQAPHGL
jgi:hypothetical protein